MNPALKKMIDNGWGELAESPEFVELSKKLKQLFSPGNKPVTPAPHLVFRPFLETRLEDVKVVIIGRDPYCTPGTANGFALAANTGTPPPPALRYLIQEVNGQTKSKINQSKVTLDAWVKQGVFLLNAALTVEVNNPASHMDIWNDFTRLVVKTITRSSPNKVFVLWGDHAIKLKDCIDLDKDLILEGAPPYQKTIHLFKGNDHFNKVNKFLTGDFAGNQTPIDWTAIDLIDLGIGQVSLPEWTQKDEAYDRTSKCRY